MRKHLQLADFGVQFASLNERNIVAHFVALMFVQFAVINCFNQIDGFVKQFGGRNGTHCVNQKIVNNQCHFHG